MNEMIKIFESEEFGKVRTVVRDGEPWFVAADVCKTFGVTNNRNVIARLDDDEKDVQIVDTLGGEQKMSVVNEPGLYRMLFTMCPTNARGIGSIELQARQEKLKAFKRWITHEVIPQIRKTGGYIPVEKGMSDMEIMARALQISQRTISEKEALISAMQPKVDYYEDVIESGNEYTATSIAKNYGWSAQQLNKYLHDKRIIYYQDGIWNLYNQYANLGLAHVRYTQNIRGYVGKQLKWTEHGKQFIHELLLDDGYNLVA